MQRTLLTLAILAFLIPTTAAADSPARGQLYYWVWWKNLGGHWRELIDFTAEQKFDGVVIWGLRGWKGDGRQCREVVEYAHARNVKVIHGLGLNGYEVGKQIVGDHPELAAKLPPELAKTKKGKWTRAGVFCPSRPESLKLLRESLLRAAATGIDGFNFETADVDYITCHCPACEKRFASADETEHRNKPIGWPLEHLAFAADVLAEKYPKLWLNCEFAMQRFGKRPYTDCQRILELNRRIDPRMTVVWAEAWAPPEDICRRLSAERENIGFYIRSGAIYGFDAKQVLGSEELLPIARRLDALDPVCLMYRCYRPIDSWAVNMGVAARILHKPRMTSAEVAATTAEFQKETEPGGRYSFVQHVTPGNLVAPGGSAKLSASSGNAIRAVDGVADANEGIWHTERNSPKEAWLEAHWPKPVTIDRVRLFHQQDGHYRSLDYTIQYNRAGRWHDVQGMPIKDNATHGWSEHAFPAVTTARLRLLITRSRHGNRMGVGEWEVFGAKEPK